MTMPTPQEIRRERLLHDQDEMRRIQSTMIRITSFGSPPERYILTLRVRTIIGPRPDYRAEHRVRVTLPAGYPAKPPEIVMLSQPQPFHPNWWPQGLFCYGSWTMEESLGDHILRMIRTLQFDPEITNPKS